jgi:PTH1 family peptidyl-tRNA hydrolase
MFLFAGLGNPGQNYAMNRHNVGFMAIDRLAALYDFPAWQKKAASLQTTGQIDRSKIILLKPQSYMNKSGLPVAEVARFHKIPTSHIYVFHDELDLAAGRVRVKQGGGHGGHNGLRDIDRHLGQDYWRIRIGIGRPDNPAMDVKSWVLADFTKTETSGWVPDLLRAISDEAPRLTTHDYSGFMSRVAFLAPPPKPPQNETSKDI